MLTALALGFTLAASPGLRLIQEDAPVVAPGTAERHAKLLSEITELTEARPRVTGGILLTTGGALTALGGVAFAWVGLLTATYYAFSFAAGSVVLLSVGIALFAIGVPMTVVGAVKLHQARKARNEIDQRLEQLDREEAGMQTIVTF